MICAGVFTSLSGLSGPSPTYRCFYRRQGGGVGAVLLLAALCLFFVVFPMSCWGQMSQTITFTQPPPTQAFAGTSVVLAATASSGLPVSFTVASGPAQVSGVNGSTLTYIGVGTVVVQANQAGGSGYSSAPSVLSSPVDVRLLIEPVTTSSVAMSTVVAFTTAGTLGQISALTQGAANQDFNVPTGVSLGPDACTVGVSYNVGQTCSVEFTFTPTRPGIRYGGIVLSDSLGNVLANSYIYGEGTGPQVLYDPVVQTLIGSSLGQPSGVAINGNGDLFVSNYVFGTGAGGASGLVEIPANGTAATPVNSFPAGKDVAVDGSGNVFVVTTDTLYEVTAVNGTIPASPVIRTLATGFDVYDGGLAIDGSGNAYIAQCGAACPTTIPSGVVYEVYAVGGVIPSFSPLQTIGPLFAEPTGVAVDHSGNVYISDGAAPAIFEMVAVNGQVPASPTVLTLGSGYVTPSNIRLDDTNDIFISDSRLPGVLEFPATNGVVAPSTLPKPIDSGFDFIEPQGLLVDDSGNVFVADQGYPEVIKLNYSSVPTLTFAPTQIGQTSVDSPQAVTYTNAGNADLVFTPPLSGSNPVITSSFTLGANSTCPQLSPGSSTATLGVGQSCTDQVSFTPLAAGLITGTLTTADNNLSVTNATQAVPLNGTGVLETPIIQFNVGNHYVDDPPFLVLASSPDSPGAFTYSVQSGPATIKGSTVALSGTTGMVTLVANLAQSFPYAAGSATASFSVIKHSQTINFMAPVTPVLPTTSPVTLAATASSGLPVVFSVVSGPGTVTGNLLRFTGYGLIVVAADQPGNAIYDAAPEVTRPVFVLDNRVVVTLTGTPNPVFLNNPLTFSASIAFPAGTPTGSILFLDGTTALATAPLNGTTASLTTASLPLGTHKITAVYSGDSTFATSTSAALNVLVEDFSLTISNPDVTISHGGTAVYNLTVTTVGGTLMASAIQFGVTGNPDHSPLTFSPPQVATGSGTTQLTLTIQTPDYPVGPWTKNAEPESGRGFALAFLPMGVLFGLGWRRRRSSSRFSRLAIVLLAVGMTVGATALSGCGGWGAQPYSMTITASSGALSHSVGASLVSQ